MKPTQDKYPVFEANQVLTNAHLNQAINYLDEQERLTRANLIGIGIVCGLDIRLDNVTTPTTIHLSKGCGITSEGYLIVESKDVVFGAYRKYELPEDIGYPPFKGKDMWELFPAGEPDTTPLGADPRFLDNKAVLLFLELKKTGLRNCSPNNCDDKGAEVMATVRRLLIKVDDLTKIIAAANQLGVGLTFTDLETALLARLNLPDLRLPRYDVPNTSPVTSNIPNTSPVTSSQVLAAFQAVFQTDKLALNTGNALIAAYKAFEPVVREAYSANPFADFNKNFGFLDNTPTTTTQVRFLQYYYDFFDDLLRAYDEFRWKGVELMCACCPPEGLFPRHLMLGELFPASVSNPSIYRHHFLASSVIGSCEERTKELKQLFRRMVEMIARFTNTPLPQSTLISQMDTQIRITPSKLADVPLSDKAIPYYYLQDGTPPLYQLWNAEKTRKNRANQNLSYRSDKYTPPAPAFVTNPLRYDLEPYNFLRIEGHLGKNYQRVLTTLLALKSQYRLPIEVIALRTGAFDENMTVNLSKEECRFQDLETLYDTLKAELSCFLCKEVQYFYNLPYEAGSIITTPVKPKLPLLAQCDPDFLVQPQTLGRLFEDWLSTLPGEVIPDIDLNLNFIFLNRRNVNQLNSIIFIIIIYISKLFDQLFQELGQLNFVNFEKLYRDLVSVTAAIEREREQATGTIEGNANLLNWEELDDRLEAIIYSCRLDAFRTLLEEYKRRIKEVKQKQFLSYFLQKNPGIQHKAGVPLGGTFIVVYHDNPDLIFTADIDSIITNFNQATFSSTSTKALSGAFTRLQTKKEFVIDPDFQLIFTELTGQTLNLNFLPGNGELSQDVDKMINETVNGLEDGTVIADFFLPYLCCSDCAPVQFVLSKTSPTFSFQIGCTNSDKEASVTLIPKGGTPPYSVKVDNEDFLPFSGSSLKLSTGKHTIAIRDTEETISATQIITITEPLTLSAPVFDCINDNNYIAVFQISGGTPPYIGNGALLDDNTFTTAPAASGTAVTVEIFDQNKCTVKTEVQHVCAEPCNLPCDGQSRRCAYRLWLQPPTEVARYEVYKAGSGIKFSFNDTDFDLPGANAILQLTTAQLNGDFQNAMAGVFKQLNSLINKTLIEAFGQSGKNRLLLTYEPRDNDPFAVFRIEHFVCETFSMEFSFAYGTGPVFEVNVRYTNEQVRGGAAFNGMILTNSISNIEHRVPAFDCSERNQCTNTDYTALCKGDEPKPSFIIEHKGDNQYVFAGKVENMDPGKIAGWVWDAPDAIPAEPFYTGENTEGEFKRAGDGGPVKLTVITDSGCFSTIDKLFGQ